jgi:peroxiredoxin
MSRGFRIWVACAVVWLAVASPGGKSPRAQGVDNPGTAGANAPPQTPLRAADLVSRHDRSLIRDLLEYVAGDPSAADIDQAYLTVFEIAIKNDWFLEHEAAARRYLDTKPDGAVRPMAQIVVVMGAAQAGNFAEATAGFQRLIQGLDGIDQAEFALSFADSLAEKTVEAGEHPLACRVYETVRDKFGDDEATRADMQRKIDRLNRIGRPVADFTVRDLDGQTLSLGALKGKYVLLDFWATWCAPCVERLPEQIALYRDWHKRGFEVVGISLDDSPEEMRDFVKERQVPWPQVHHATCGADLVAALGVDQIPATYLIGPDGTLLRLDVRGKSLKDALEQQVETPR